MTDLKNNNIMIGYRPELIPEQRSSLSGTTTPVINRQWY